jgi:hypothetical protein
MTPSPNPDTLPADFFSRKKNENPDTLPADFFSGNVPAFPKSGRTGDLPDITNQDIKSVARKALDWAPAVGATLGAIAAPELIPAYPLIAGVAGAALGGAAGSTVKQGTLAATDAPDAPKTFSEAAGNVGQDALEQGAMEAGGRFVAKPLEYVASRMFSPRTMYQSALKPSVALDKSIPGSVDAMEAQRRVQTGLREGSPTSEGGYNTTVNRISDVNRQIGSVVGRPSVQMVDPIDVARRLDDLEKYYSKQALPGDDLASIKAARRQYLEKHGAQFDPKTGAMTQQPNLMTPVAAHEEKVATYTQNRKKYGELTTAQTEAEKALARGLKEELLRIYPELKDLNERDSALYGLEESLRRFIGREGNKNLIGLIPAILGTGAGMMTGHGAEGAVAGSLLSGALMALDSPPVKSSLAIALERVAKSKVGMVGRQLTPARALPAIGRAGMAATDASRPITIDPDKIRNTPPRFAKGGWAGIHGEEKVIVGDGGEPELIIPLSHIRKMGPQARKHLFKGIGSHLGIGKPRKSSLGEELGGRSRHQEKK